MVSGYLYKPGRSYGENMAHKAKRLLVPYFGYSALLLVFYRAIGRTWQETGRSALGVLYSRYCLFDTTTHQDNVFLFTVANGAMWYLTAFFVTSLVYHLVIDRCLKSRRFMIGCLVVLTVLTMLLAELPILLPWSLDLAFVGTIFMIAGTLLQRADFFDRDWNLWVIIGILVFYLSLSRANRASTCRCASTACIRRSVFRFYSDRYYGLHALHLGRKSIPELHCGYGVSLYRAEYDCSSGASYSRT